MDRYYYLVASLPYLKFGQRAPLSRENFLELCAQWVSQADYALLLKTNWNQYDRPLREELALVRRSRRTGAHQAVSARAKEILDEINPLERELEFERARWEIVEELEAGHFFDIMALRCYLLKLQILERLGGFDAEAGKAALEKFSTVTYA